MPRRRSRGIRRRRSSGKSGGGTPSRPARSSSSQSTSKVQVNTLSRSDMKAMARFAKVKYHRRFGMGIFRLIGVAPTQDIADQIMAKATMSGFRVRKVKRKTGYFSKQYLIYGKEVKNYQRLNRITRRLRRTRTSFVNKSR